jgi:glycosyltransferase involved in cell wall biosynthesis
LFVGQRDGYKNFWRLAQAFADSDLLSTDCELLAFGGRPFSRHDLTELERLGIRHKVRRKTGSDRELAAAYERATVFVCPSLYEGFGIPPLEAMSHGCPVVSSDRASLPEVVGDAGLYVDPENVDELRETLERVVATSSLQSDLRARGLRRSRAFSWAECAASTARLYGTLH